MLARSASMANRIAMYNGNALKIGLFGANCSSGRSATKVRPDEQLAPNSPILSTLPLYMAMRLGGVAELGERETIRPARRPALRHFAMDALRASTTFLPDVSIIIAAMVAAIKASARA